MASINGILANEKSMSGVVESPIGETIECTTLIADSVETQNIYAQDGLLDCSLFNNDYATITLGNSATNLMNLGGFQFLVDTFRHITTSLNLYLFPTSTGVINFATSASQILFGSSTALVSSKVPTANNHLTNKLYVDTAVSSGGILSSNNTFTGTNTFASPSLTQNLVLDSQTSTVSQIKFRTNTADPTMDTCRIRASSGTIADRGRLSLYGGIVEWFSTNMTFWSTALTQSLLFDPTSTTGSVFINFRTSSSPSSTGVITASITGSGGTTANSGTITNTANIITDTCSQSIINATNSHVITSPIFAILGATQGIRINSDTSGEMSVLFRTNTASPTQTSSKIVGTGGTSTNGGTLTITAENQYMEGANFSINSTGITALNSSATYITGTAWAKGNILAQNTTSIPMTIWSNSNAGSFIQLTGNTNIDAVNIPWNAMLITRYNFATAITLTLVTASNYENTFFTIYNAGSANITLTSPNNRIFGPSLLRGGVNTLTIGSNTARRVRGTIFNGATNILNNTLGAGFFIEVIS